MQMTGTPIATPGNKSPPPPMVQQSVGSAGHSRNVSQGSSKSQTANPAAIVQAKVEEHEAEAATSVAVAVAKVSIDALPVQAKETQLPKEIEVKQEHETPKTP